MTLGRAGEAGDEEEEKGVGWGCWMMKFALLYVSLCSQIMYIQTTQTH